MTDTTLPETPEARAHRKAEVAKLYQDGGSYIGHDTLTPARAAAEYHDSEETRLRKALTMKQLELRQAKNEIARLRDTLHKIAYLPFGPSDATADEVLRDITQYAREALK